MKRAFKWVGMLLLAYIIFFGSYFYYSLYSGSARMAKLCGQIKPGMAWTDLIRFGSENDFLVSHDQVQNGVTRMAEGRTMGRYGCEVAVKGGLVKDALPFHLD
jgi:hypothetical protein